MTTAARRYRAMVWVRRILDALIVTVLLLVVLTGTLYWYLRARQPAYEGELRLVGLQARVEIIRDEHAAPHIRAANLHDLLVAEGYAMAQDRLWQMDLMRRLAEGRLSEIFGGAALDSDREMRTLGLNRVAAAEAERLSAGDGAIVDAFDSGVNSFISRRGHRLPLEFLVLRYRPEPWQRQDTMAVAAYMYRTLTSGYKSKLEREAFVAKVGPLAAAELFPESSDLDVIPGAPLPAGLLPQSPAAPIIPPGVPTMPVNGGRGRGEAGGTMPAGLASGTLPAFEVEWPQATGVNDFFDAGAQGGSNNWALSGGRSMNGKPILANDPHLAYQVPGLWWEVELESPEVQVAGVTLPGIPGVTIGHNRRIAWGVTNTGADVQELYREKIDAKGEETAGAGGGAIEHVHEHIGVKGGPGEDLDVQMTSHGPIVARDAGGALALDWSLYKPGSLQSVGALLAIDEAGDWKQFEQALSHYAGPVQNFVYADVDGHIGFQTAGLIPVRAAGDGSLPVPGDDRRYGWKGWIPFGQLPHAADPASGVMVTANGRVAPEGYPYTIATRWEAPMRTRRIYELLERPKYNPSAMGRIQEDVVSEFDRDFAQAVVAAANAEAAKGRKFDSRSQQALTQLRIFRGAMGRGALAPTLSVEVRRELLAEVLEARAGAELAKRYDWPESPLFVRRLLTTRPAEWLPSGYQEKGSSGWETLLADCLVTVADRHTIDYDDLHWGALQTIFVPHPLWTHVPEMHKIADLGPTEINGSPLTVKQAQNTSLGNKLSLGPSMRFVADVADWDRSTVTLFEGESGQVFSPFYRDEFGAYLNGQALPLWFSEAAVEKHRVHTLRLKP